MSGKDYSASQRTKDIQKRTIAYFHTNNPLQKEGGNRPLEYDEYLNRFVGRIILSCPVSSCSPGEITGIISPDNGNGNDITVTWDPLPGAISYTVTLTKGDNDFVTPTITHTPSSSTTATLTYSNGNSTYSNIGDTITVTADTSCGSTSTSITNLYPCFLAGSLVHMADGSVKVIEDVQVNDFVLGAFGEINTVLALHRPLLGLASMCKINNEHSTTNHHPHVSLDKQFYCGNPDLVSKSTYGHKHTVITAEGTTVERMLYGLNKERIQKLHTGVVLKTIEGSRITNTIEVYSMPEDTQLYNLVIDGSHTYHVDGYAVTGWPSEHDFDYDTWSNKKLNPPC